VALNELQALVEDLARRIDAPAVLEDHEQRMVVYSAQDGPIDDVRRDSILRRETRPEVRDWFRQFGIAQASSPLRIPSHPELGILGRLCVPVRFRGRLLGFLFLIDDVRRLDGPDIDLAERVSRHAGLLLYEDELDRRLSASVFSHLLTPDLEMRQVAARQLAEQGLVAADAPHAVVVVRLASGPVPGPGEVIGEAMLELQRRRVHPGLLQMARPDHGVLLVPVASADDDRQVAVTAREASAALARGISGVSGVSGVRSQPHGGDVRVITGIGDLRLQLADAHHSYREALLAAKVAAAVPTVGDLVRWRDLGAFRALVLVPLGDDVRSSCVDPRLLRLIDCDEDLAGTVETYLDLGCDAKRTAEQLRLHRGTLYYRLAKAAQLTGADLRNGNDRLALHLGFKLARLNGSYPPAGSGGLGPRPVHGRQAGRQRTGPPD
jgi:PucR C-terminal helix-turn-helix domain/GGDEF-like domain